MLIKITLYALYASSITGKYEKEIKYWSVKDSMKISNRNGFQETKTQQRFLKDLSLSSLTSAWSFYKDFLNDTKYGENLVFKEIGGVVGGKSILVL